MRSYVFHLTTGNFGAVQQQRCSEDVTWPNILRDKIDNPATRPDEQFITLSFPIFGPGFLLAVRSGDLNLRNRCCNNRS
jgi:hypothetical protein